MLIKGAWLAIFLVDFATLYMADKDFDGLDYTRNPANFTIYSLASFISLLSVANSFPKLFLACSESLYFLAKFVFYFYNLV